MADAAKRYYGVLCRLESDDDTTHIELQPNAVMLGTAFELTQESRVSQRGKEYERVIVHDSRRRAVGFLPKETAKRVIGFFDEGWLCHVTPMFVAYDKTQRAYWVEVALVCYPPENAPAFDAFFSGFCKRVASGDHPNPNLSEKQVEQIIASNGAWNGLELAPLPHMGKDGAIYKSGRSNTEKLMMAAVEHTTGCYIVLIAATLLVVLAVVWFLFLR